MCTQKAIETNDWKDAESIGKMHGMNQVIDLPDVTIERVPGGLLVTHKRTQASLTISAESLQRWLIRQLRSIF